MISINKGENSKRSVVLFGCFVEKVQEVELPLREYYARRFVQGRRGSDICMSDILN